MFFLKELISTARSQGVLSNVFGSPSSEFIRVVPSKGHGFTDAIIEKCQPFIFDVTPEQAVDVYRNLPPLAEDGGDSFSLKSPPFPVFSIETPGVPLMMFHESIVAGVNVQYGVFCLVCHEVAPTKWEYYALFRERFSEKNMVVTADSFGTIAEQYLKYLHVNKIGSQSIREKIKIGSGKSKRTHVIRNVIHVTSKKTYQDYKPRLSRPIDWHYRWAVRGHWRDNPGKTGKDRDGNYTIRDFTWVVDHVKGPDNLPLITKQRVVETSLKS